MDELLRRVRALAALLEKPELATSGWVAAVDAEWCAIAEMRVKPSRERLLEALFAELAGLPDAGIRLLTEMARELKATGEKES
ncbi:MAG TPA: hypothetical protein VMB03_16540 [Bryobacteraceae bacterium]|nr:hypothetical protein [Bryobacteraceae bacterium]